MNFTIIFNVLHWSKIFILLCDLPKHLKFRWFVISTMNIPKFYTITDWSNLSGFHYGQAVFVSFRSQLHYWPVKIIIHSLCSLKTTFQRFLVWSVYAAGVAFAVWAAIQLDGPAVEGDTSSEGFGALRAPSTSSANTTAM